MAELPILNDKQLRTLASVIWHQEATRIYNIKFSSSGDRNKYVNNSKACYDSAISILDAGVELQSKNEKDDIRAPIAQGIVSYLINSLNLALQTLNNYTLRLDFLTKISDSSASFATALAELDPENATNVAQLAQKADQSNNAMLFHIKKYNSADSSAFSKSLKIRGITFEMLVQTYQAQLGFHGKFADLEDVQKLQVYEKIIEASGRGKPTQLTATLQSDFEPFIGPAEAAVLFFAAGKMVWDIFSSDYVFKSVTEDAVDAVAEVGGAILGEIVAAALATELETTVEATTLYLVTAGVLTGIGAAVFAIVELAGVLIDLIFGSGGSAPLSTDGIHCYVSSMPDGVTLARQIVHG